jgi:hypothetical protein
MLYLENLMMQKNVDVMENKHSIVDEMNTTNLDYKKNKVMNQDNTNDSIDYYQMSILKFKD